jgi:hypothetical protein
MQGGDISNVGPPTIIVVFDDLIGHRRPGLPPEPSTPGQRWRERLRIGRTITPDTHWDLDPIVVSVLQRLFIMGRLTIDIVTFVPEVREIDDLLSAAEVPCGGVTYCAPDQLARRLAYRPDVTAVYHPYPEHGWKYGSRGRTVTPDLRTKIGMM